MAKARARSKVAPGRKPSSRPAKPTKPSKSSKAAKPIRRAAATKKPRPRVPRAMTRVQEPAREPALEAAIVEAPLDLVPRMIYGDWLQGAGEKRGEWVTLQAGVEAEPGNARLRAAAVEFLDNHRVALLGAGAPMLAAGWIGWRGGFIDELRVQPYEREESTLAAFVALLAHPTCRFVRYVTLGALEDAQAYVDTLAAAAPPLLEGVAIFDARGRLSVEADLDDEAFDSLRRFALNQVVRTRPMPNLEELYVRLELAHAKWLAQPFPALRELTLECGRGWISAGFVVGLLQRMPSLKRLRFLGVRDADRLVEAIAPHVGNLELLDISHADLTDAGAARLFGAPRLELLALRTSVSPAMTRQLEDQLAKVTVSGPVSLGLEWVTDDHLGAAWPSHRLRTEGREALRLVPAVGVALNYIGINHTNNDRDELAAPVLEATVSMPAPELHTWPWASAAFTYERLGRYDDCELIAREGLLHAPRETNFYAFILYALRKTGRSAEALRLIKRVHAALRHAKSERQTNGARACLISAMTTLAQAGRHAEAIEIYLAHPTIAEPNAQAVAAMSYHALGKRASAKAAFRKATTRKLDEFTLQPRRRGCYLHAKAVLDVAAGDAAAALEALARAKADRYYDWHWIADDPNLAALRDDPGFVELLATPPPAIPKA